MTTFEHTARIDETKELRVVCHLHSLDFEPNLRRVINERAGHFTQEEEAGFKTHLLLGYPDDIASVLSVTVVDIDRNHNQ